MAFIGFNESNNHVKGGSFTTNVEIENEEIKQDILRQVKELSGGDK
jgi:hypothetical protein